MKVSEETHEKFPICHPKIILFQFVDSF